MGRKALDLDLTRADYILAPDAPPLPKGRPRRPLRAVLVGGQRGYGNVAKFPDKLWEVFGAAAIGHVVERRKADALSERVDLAVMLVDQTSHELAAWGRTVADKTVFVPSSWSKAFLAIKDVGIKPYAGEHFVAPVVDPVPPPLALLQPESLPEDASEDDETQELPMSTHPYRHALRGMEAELSDVALERQMICDRLTELRSETERLEKQLPALDTKEGRLRTALDGLRALIEGDTP